MLDARLRNGRARIYDTEKELADYTNRTGKYIRKSLAYNSGLLMYLLREILEDSHGDEEPDEHKYYGARPGGVGSKRGEGTVRVHPQKRRNL